MASSQKPVFGPNDFNLASGNLEPGLGPEEEQKIREARGQTIVTLEEPPAKAELRKQADELKNKARQLSVVERQLEQEREAREREFAVREDAVAEREARVEAALKQLEG